MKTLKAYTFEELLCEIPELEKKDIETIPKAMKKFCRENKLIFANSSNVIFLDGTPHFLFEKL